MKFGLTSDELKFLHLHVIEPLKKEGAQVWIFGSRARGDQKKFSDIDLLYDLPKEKALSQGLLSEIRETLEESHLPYKVDLVDFKELAASYRQNVIRDRIEV